MIKQRFNRPDILFYFLIFILSSIKLNYAQDASRVMRVFDQIQSKTGFWNVNISIKPEGKALFVDNANTIIISEKIISLCFNGYSESEGNDRLAFLLSHEIAHLMNKDLDYDRFLNPFKDKLSNEAAEAKKQKEISADLRAVSIMIVSGFNTSQFTNKTKNIITDFYALYGLKMDQKSGNYMSANNRVKLINDRKPSLNEYNKLYDCGVKLLLLSDGNNEDEFPDIAIDAFNTYQNYTSLITPELLNNLGMCFLKNAKRNYSKDLFKNNDTAAFPKIDFNQFESGYVINSEAPKIRAVGLQDYDPGKKQNKDINELRRNYNTFIKKALSSFKQADLNSDDVYLPSRLNKAALYGLNRQYDEAQSMLEIIEKNNCRELKHNNLLPYFYNLRGIIEYCINNKQKAYDYFNLALKENSGFITSLKNKYLIERNSVDYNSIYPNNEKEINISDLMNSIYETYKQTEDPKTKGFSFGQNDRYIMKYTETDSLNKIIVTEEQSGKSVELISLKSGSLKNGKLKIGMKKNEALENLPDDCSIVFSLNKSFYNFPKLGLITCFDENNYLTEIIIYLP